jgi:hypothetical protein
MIALGSIFSAHAPRSATELNGQAAKEEVSALWRGGWMPENISGVPTGRSVFHLTSPLIGLLARNNLRLAGHPGTIVKKDPRGYLWPTDITNSLVSENSVIDQFGESNLPDLLLPSGLENRFQEAAVFI